MHAGGRGMVSFASVIQIGPLVRLQAGKSHCPHTRALSPCSEQGFGALQIFRRASSKPGGRSVAVSGELLREAGVHYREFVHAGA